MQANGLDERFNQTLQNMLVKFVDEKKECWEDFLSTCVYAYNTSKHESSKYCPFTVMFGWQAILPVEVSSPKKEDAFVNMTSEANKDRIIDDHLSYRSKVAEKVKENIIAAQARQKKAYDRKRHNPETFKAGALVLRKDMKRKKRAGGKLDFKWLGPYMIVQSMGRGLYQIQDVNDPKQKLKVHGIHLKLFHPSTKVCNIMIM